MIGPLIILFSLRWKKRARSGRLLPPPCWSRWPWNSSWARSSTRAPPTVVLSPPKLSKRETSSSAHRLPRTPPTSPQSRHENSLTTSASWPSRLLAPTPSALKPSQGSEKQIFKWSHSSKYVYQQLTIISKLTVTQIFHLCIVPISTQRYGLKMISRWYELTSQQLCVNIRTTT